MPSITRNTLITFALTLSLFLVTPYTCVETAFLDYKCYLNYDQGPDKRIRINFTQFNMIYYNEQKDDFKTWPSAIMRLSLRNSQNQEQRVTKVRLSTDNMNILHYHENGKDVDIRLANSAVLKFYSVYIYVYLLKDTYEKPDQVSLSDVMNRSLYFDNRMPYFTFTDKDGEKRTAHCEINLPGQSNAQYKVETQFDDPEMNLVNEQNKSQVVNTQGALNFEHKVPEPVNDLHSFSQNQVQERASSQTLPHNLTNSQNQSQDLTHKNQHDFLLVLR